MTPCQHAAAAFARRMAGAGLPMRTGPFTVRLRSGIGALHRAVALMYAGYPVADDQGFCDVTLQLVRGKGLRRWLQPQVRLKYDGGTPFEPLPLAHAFALFEWSMNWWISANAHQYLLLHAAVVERAGCAAILPAPPGSGKSTLCAGLTQRGWRLLSDELALISLADGQLYPLVRPVSLKNESIGLIRAFAPAAVFSAETPATTKGTVAHLRANAEDVARMDEPARPRWVVFPRFAAGAPARLVARPKADAMIELGRNAFNYALLGQAGFESLAGVISASDCHDFSYGRLDDAVSVFDALAQAHDGQVQGRRPVQ